MLNYGLCKKLKDAGFPQKGNQGYYINEADKVCFTTDWNITDTAGVIIEYFDPEHRVISKTSKAYVVIVPTLSELIEECGDRFMSIETAKAGMLGPFDRQYGGWCCDYYEGNRYLGKIIGFSPEEVVANLWLKLNEKK